VLATESRKRKTERFAPTLDETTRNDCQTRKELAEESDSQMRMINSDTTTKENQYNQQECWQWNQVGIVSWGCA
jgi:hypothetical protein